MATFWGYLIALLINLLWRRMGGAGAAPPFRLPRGRHLAFPDVSPWHIVFVLYLLKKVWQNYGHDVRTKMETSDRVWLRHIVKWLPDAPAPAQPAAGGATAGAGTGGANAGQPAAQPARYATRPLPSSAPKPDAA
jgi:hypothetical protein